MKQGLSSGSRFAVRGSRARGGGLRPWQVVTSVIHWSLTFGPDGVLFAADTQAATIYALGLGDKANGGAPGTQAVDAIDQKIAGLLGTDAKEIAITDMVVHPRTRNAYIAVRRGQGTASKPALLRVDGAGKIEVVSFENMKHSKVALPNAPNAGTNPQRDPRQQSVTDM